MNVFIIASLCLLLAMPAQSAPNSDAVRLVLEASALMSRAQYDQALEKCSQALAASPDYAPGHARMAECYERIGLPELAAAEWKKVAELAPDDELAETAASKQSDLKDKQNIVVPVADKKNSLWRFRWRNPLGIAYEWHEQLDGRDGVMKMHPVSTVEPAVLQGRLEYAADPGPLALELEVKGEEDCVFEVSVNGERIDRQILDGAQWRKLSYDLTKFLKGQPIDIEFRNAAGGKQLWHFESAFIDYINVTRR